jgi:hypothetical protein
MLRGDVGYRLHDTGGVTHQAVVATSQVMRDRRRFRALDFRIRGMAPYTSIIWPFAMVRWDVGHRLHDAGRMAHQALIASREIVLYGRRFRCLLNRSQPHDENGSNGYTHSEITHNFPPRFDE